MSVKRSPGDNIELHNCVRKNYITGKPACKEKNWTELDGFHLLTRGKDGVILAVLIQLVQYCDRA